MGEETEIPNYGLKVKLDHEYEENRSPNFIPSLKIVWSMLPLILRYIWYYIMSKLTGKFVVMDYFILQTAKRIYGVPLGGIGCGTIGRGYRGEFCRFQLKPGLYEHNTVDANQFIVTIKDSHQKTVFQSLLSAYPKSGLKSWKSLIDPSKCTYTGLYPRAWTEYDLSDYGIKLICRQVSPVIPNDYENSSIPAAVFIWEVVNLTSEEKTVTIALTFKNGTGTKKQDEQSICSSKAFATTTSEGVILHHTINKMNCSYVLSVKSQPQNKMIISKCLNFNPNSDGSTIWSQLYDFGKFQNVDNKVNQTVGELGCGIAAKTKIASFEKGTIEMSLIWHMPVVTFPEKKKSYNRFYTKKFGVDSVLSIVDYVFKHYGEWEKSIYDWQNPILTSNLPDWYKGALFNETYFISDGGSLWLTVDAEEMSTLSQHDPRRKVGRFIYLEGHEYKMFNSYDVHFYASHALHHNWPMLQKALNYDLKHSVFLDIPDKVTMLFDGAVVCRKYANTVPHDIGAPGEQPFSLVNSYPIHDVSQWRDLSTKFVLQVFRDAATSSSEALDLNYIKDMYNACYVVMEKAQSYDIDNDGLIENSGKPDQTYDAWTMDGSSAYCGLLWLGALYAMTIMSEAIGKMDDKDKFEKILEKAKEAFDRKLWNGSYYNFDCSEKQKTSIMADQLCGHWYLRCCGITNYPLIPKEKVQTTLKTIYDNNVLNFRNGTIGAVNGFINGDVDYVAVQSQEVWTGVTYALASLMIFEGMVNEGFKTAEGMFNTMAEKCGLLFDTPEALYATKYYRSIGYMRPLSIWSMHLALQCSQRN